MEAYSRTKFLMYREGHFAAANGKELPRAIGLRKLRSKRLRTEIIFLNWQYVLDSTKSFLKVTVGLSYSAKRALVCVPVRLRICRQEGEIALPFHRNESPANCQWHGVRPLRKVVGEDRPGTTVK